MSQNGKAITEKKTFSRTTKISQFINAEPSKVWGLISNSSEFERWNSTIISLQGKIEMGQKITLVSHLDPNRTFILKVKEVQPNKKLVWGDTMGERIYLLEKKEGGTIFTMQEKIGGLMFPLFARLIPSFDESFERFVADLKNEAEK